MDNMEKSKIGFTFGIIGGILAIVVAIIFGFVFLVLGAFIAAFGAKVPSYFMALILLMFIGGFLGIVGGMLCVKKAKIGGIVEIVGAVLMCPLLVYIASKIFNEIEIEIVLFFIGAMTPFTFLMCGGVKSILQTKK